jgi:DNA-directed RNA polymerase sigma subunit (sigma70/sigma32)
LFGFPSLFNLRKAKSKISVLEEGDLQPDQVKLIARRLGVTEQDVVDMNRRLRGDVSLNAPIRDEGDSGEWQDWLVDEVTDQETRLAEGEEADKRRQALGEATPASRASAYGRSRYAPLRRFRRRLRTASPRSKLRCSRR